MPISAVGGSVWGGSVVSIRTFTHLFVVPRGHVDLGLSRRSRGLQHTWFHMTDTWPPKAVT